MQLSLWALAIVSVTAGGLFYREHQRFMDEQQPREAALAVVDAPGQASARPASGAAAGPPAAQPSATSDAAAGGAASAVGALRAEVAELRDRLERHDKMLRYVMDRYVEKGDSVKRDLPIAGAAPTEEHQASAVNLSAPEFVSKSFDGPGDESGGRGDALRKRKGVGDAVGPPDLGG